MNTTKPYVNLIPLPYSIDDEGNITDRLFELHWCHDSMAAAIDYYRHITGEKLSLERLVDRRDETEGMLSLLFGALRVSEGITFADFQALLQSGITTEQIRPAVIIGVANYWLEPEPQAEITEFDLQWPEIKAKHGKHEFYYPGFQLELLEAGFRLDEIGKLTMRGMEEILRNTRGDREDPGERWLFGED